LPAYYNAQGISKAFWSQSALFKDVSFTLSECDRIGLIWPEWLGKSTLLRILAGSEDPDRGRGAVRNGFGSPAFGRILRSRDTVRSVVEHTMQGAGVPQSERGTRFAETLGRAGFENVEAEATALSGGWQRTLAIVEALVQKPDICCWMNYQPFGSRRNRVVETLLHASRFACVVVSHRPLLSRKCCDRDG